MPFNGYERTGISSDYEMVVTIRYRAKYEDSGDEHGRILAAIQEIPGVNIVGDPDSSAVLRTPGDDRE